MPRGDRSGPEGRGPMTGRKLGYCAGNDRPGFLADAEPAGRGFGRGFRRGFGRGQGYGRGYGHGFGRGQGYGCGYGYGFGRGIGGPGQVSDFPVEPETTNALAAEVAALKDQLRALEERLGDSLKED